MSLDAGTKSGSPSAWSPAGPNYRLTAIVGKRRCRLIQEADTQSNIMDYVVTSGRRSGFIFNVLLAPPAGKVCKFEYQLENSPLKVQGEETPVLGKKVSVHGGKVEFLLEGPEASSEASPAASAEGGQQGAVPLFR